MEKHIKILQKISHTFYGVNLIKNTPKPKFQRIKNIFTCVCSFTLAFFTFHTAFFNKNCTKNNSKPLLISESIGGAIVLIIYISYWNYSTTYQSLVKWVENRHISRNYKIIDGIAKEKFPKIAKFLWVFMM